MAVAGHRVFPVLVLWLLVQLTYSGADAMGYSFVRCTGFLFKWKITSTMEAGDVTVQWCLEFCDGQEQAYAYGGLRRPENKDDATCYCLNEPVQSFNDTDCDRTCGSGGGLQCGGQSYVSVYRDVNECLTDNGGCNQTCVNSPGSFSCQCREGYIPASSSCLDVNECLTDNGGCNQTCVNSPGSFSCQCRAGYKEAGSHCTDIDECSTGNGGCDHHCTNTPGGYSCSCWEGYLSDNTTCTDIDECADPTLHNCPPTDRCQNKEGSFECLPQAVTTTLASGVTDVNECLNNNGGCDQTCVNSPGSFSCSCRDGYDKTATFCTDIDECITDNGGCDHNCTNTQGGYSCSCRAGYISDNTKCKDATTGKSAGAHGGGAGGLNPGVIAGVCVAAVAATTVVVVVVLVVLRRRRSKREGSITDMGRAGFVPEDNVLGTRLPNTVRSTPVALVVGRPANPVTQPAKNTDQDTQVRQPTTRTYVYDPQVKVNMFVDHVNHLKQDKNFEDEFDALIDASDHSCAAAKRSGVAAKNKYRNILPYDETRVKLKTLDDDPLTDYINASLIKGYVDEDEFMACMGPINKTVDDFWRMIWERDVPLIVMVTNIKEGGEEKCALYWPVDDEIEYGDIRVRPVKEDKWLDIVRRQFTITQGTECRTVLHLQYTAWPDKSVPSNATSMVNFVRQVGKQMKANKPTAVHCSAGVGRTGTLIALYQLLHQANREGVIDVFNCIKKLREQRTTMVQTLKQYVFIHEALAEHITTGSTLMSVDVFSETYKDIVKPGADGTSALDRQFKIIQDTRKELSEHDQDAALSKGNAAKNRDKTILPRMTHRVYLRERYSGRNAYINAVTVKGYRKPESSYVTQIPLETTVIDFWRMVSENDCRSIVLLMHDGDVEEMSRMLPDKSTPLLVAGRHVTQTGRTTGGSHQIVDLNMKETDEQNEGAATDTKEPGSEGIKLKVFKLCTKQRDELAIDDVISLHSDVEKWRRSSGDQPVVVSCLNGASLSGLYVVSGNIFEMANTEGEVDIFQLVRQAKESRPEFINSKNQYNMLYAALERYLEKYGNYANYS